MKAIVHFRDGYPIEVTLGQDGNQRTAVKHNFVNLQNSPCGFGDTDKEAVYDLCSQLGVIPFSIDI